MLSPDAAKRPTVFIGTLLLLGAIAQADGVTVTRRGGQIIAVTAGGATTPVERLTRGQSSGSAELTDSIGFAIQSADGDNLGYYFARTGSGASDWEIDLGNWNDTNGSSADFFIFEVGGNDNIQVAARFANGSYGQDVAIGGWTSTGYNALMGPNLGQLVFGLSLRNTDLKRADGSSVGQNQTLSGIRVRSSSIDGAVFLAVNPSPDPNFGQDGDGSVTVAGNLRAGQPLDLSFDGPWANEYDDSPNPFLDYRLTVRFDGPQGVSQTVPGFFDGDGEGHGSGHVWKARFAPDRPGSWTAIARFRQGNNVAISTSNTPGAPMALLDGVSIQFDVADHDPLAEGFLKWGRLQYVGGHYQKFANGPYFLKTGTNSPENILAFRGFNTVGKAGGIGTLHSFEPHIGDWHPGDPDFSSDVHDDSARGLIGALNYLSSRGVNSVFALLMNLGGDCWDAHPFLGPENSSFDKTHYELSRLRQWNTVFEHATRKGIALHFGLAETEPANETWLDGGVLGVERKLFYREMIARFAHNPAIKWTLCEENDYSIQLLNEFADYIGTLDTYDHPIGFHNNPNDFSDYNQVYGDGSFNASSLQYDPNQIGNQIEAIRSNSAGAGRPMLAHADENNPWNEGLTNSNSDDLRKRVLYDVLFSGGQIEWYAGWHDLPLGGDLTLEDFRSREEMWDLMRYARRFMEDHLPFWEMTPMDSLLSGESGAFGGGEVFAKPGQVYAIYLPDASGNPKLDLSSDPDVYTQRWYNPRNGNFVGSSTTVGGGGLVSLGSPPSSSSNDWVVLLDKPSDFSGDITALSVSAGGSQVLQLDAGAQHAGREYWIFGTANGTSPGFPFGSLHVPINIDRYTRFTARLANGPIMQNFRRVLDSNGRQTATLQVPPNLLAGLVGMRLHHAYVLVNPVTYVSQPVSLLLVP